MKTLLHDLKYAVRMLNKNRGVTLIAALALALGIGANTAIFSVAEAFLLHPVPFEDTGRIVAIVAHRPQENIVMDPVAPAAYFDWQEQAHSFEHLAAYRWDEMNLTGDGTPQKIQAFAVTSNLFDLLKVRPALGRAFLSNEDQQGQNQVLLLGQGLWERRYGSDPKVIGKTVLVDGKPFTIIGVMGKGFDFPKPAEAWVPFAFEPKDRTVRTARYVWPIGELRAGVSLEQARAEMNTIAQRITDAYPETDRGWLVRVMPVAEFVSGDLTRQYTMLLLAAVGFVLLIACANVANVQFARISGRVKEIAVRTALGASRAQIIRQLLTESILLALLGAAIGLPLAQWSLDLILAKMPPDVAKFIAGWTSIRLDTGAFLFTFALAIVSGIVSGIAPAWLSSHTNLNETLKEGGRGSTAGRSRHRLRNGLVVSEIALALVLLVGAGLLVKGCRALLDIQADYAPESLLTLHLTLPESKYAQPSARVNFYDRALERIAGLPGARGASLANTVPYANGGGPSASDFSVEARPLINAGESRTAIIQTVGPGFLSLMNVSLRDGRGLSDTDGQDTLPVAVISESLARRYFPGEHPLGKRIKVGTGDSTNPWMTVVGIVSDLRYSWLSREVVPALYRPYRQAPRSWTTLMVRVEGDPMQLVAAIRSQVASVDPELPLYDVKPMDRVISESIMGIAYVSVMMGVLGVIALVLASVGVYGVMAYSVSERLHEIGVRTALGAQSRDILRMIISKGMSLTVLGILIGLPLALGLARVVAGLLFGVSATDSFTFFGIPLALAAVAMLACYIPARRATRVDPIVALRYE